MTEKVFIYCLLLFNGNRQIPNAPFMEDKQELTKDEQKAKYSEYVHKWVNLSQINGQYFYGIFLLKIFRLTAMPMEELK